VSLVGAAEVRRPTLLRERSGEQRVTNIELFFDLVYVFAVTQLSHYLLDHPSVTGALQAGWPGSPCSRCSRWHRPAARDTPGGLIRYGLRPTPQ
jgi:hypothetical protein